MLLNQVLKGETVCFINLIIESCEYSYPPLSESASFLASLWGKTYINT